MTETRVVVIGGGYAGVMAANRLTPHTVVTLVNPRPDFVERIRLHQLAVGNDDAVAAFSDVLTTEVQLVVDDATRIDTRTRGVELAGGETLGYDYLIYAVGSTGTVSSAVPGAAEFAYPISELEQAQRLADRLAEVPAPAPIVVVGGGLTGIEGAAEFAEAGRRVTLVTDALGPTLSRGARRSVARRLNRLGVALLDQHRVARVDADRVVLGDGRELPAAVTVWTAGFGVPGLAAASGLTTDEVGRLITDETLTSIDDPRVVGAGDAVSPSGLPYRMSCQAAIPMGARAAETVLARMSGASPDAVGHGMAAQCLSLGRRRGLFQVNTIDDRARRLYIGGRTGALIKEQVCRMTIKWLRDEAQRPGSYRWRRDPDRQHRLPVPTAPVASVR
jgi:NADH dehydrogenase